MSETRYRSGVREDFVIVFQYPCYLKFSDLTLHWRVVLLLEVSTMLMCTAKVGIKLYRPFSRFRDG